MGKHGLSRTGRECACRAVRVPKHGRKVLYGEARREVGEILRMLAEHMDGVETAGGSACADRMHMCLRVAPKYAVSSVVGKLKGKSAIVLHERRPELGDHGPWPHAVGAGPLRERHRPGRGQG